MDEYFPPDGTPVVKMYRGFPTEQWIFHPDALRRLLGTGVYMLSKGDEHLYIGSAKNILNRISDENHSSFRMALCEADWISVLSRRSEKESRDDEAQYIANFQPRFNIAGKSKKRAYYENI